MLFILTHTIPGYDSKAISKGLPHDLGSSESSPYGHKLDQPCESQGQRKTLGTFNLLIHVDTLCLTGTLVSQVPLQPPKMRRMEQTVTVDLSQVNEKHRSIKI